MPPAQWARIDACLDQLLALPEGARPAAIARMAAGDAAIACELTALAAELTADSPIDLAAPDAWLDRSAAELLLVPAAAEPAPVLPWGTQLGAWRLLELLGRGGMGEVYRAERNDGAFNQPAAIKLMRVDAAASAARFQAERQIVARLDHPGIARLLDGGVASDGRPFMVMELVRGRSITDWCREQRATLEQRLALFVEVCDAVAFAHRNLIVHRDLKPANVLVTDEGRPKLLDFGVARLLDAPAGEATRELRLTPGYAAPEQLDGSPITTATDVYNLGLLLHELLTGQPAFAVQHLSLASAMQQVLTQDALPPSRVARALAAPPVAPARLAGDLDAIVAKALRKAAEQRYASVDALRTDTERWQQHLPVLARSGNWRYVALRTLRRHRVVAAAALIVMAVSISGIAAVAWQARLASDEADRANAVKAFLLQVFAASDPRIAADRPRGQVTARELLDAATPRIDAEFARSPELHIELLGAIAKLYRELGETARYAALQAQRLALAQRWPGRHTPAEVEVWLNRAGDALLASDPATARQHLAVADLLLKSGHLDDTVQRANWWVSTGQACAKDHFDEREQAYDRALALFRRVKPNDAGVATALSEKGLVAYDRDDSQAALINFRLALQAHDRADHPDDAETQTIWGNLGQTLLNLGQYDEAAAAFGQAAELAHRTYGEHHADYWIPAAQHARLLHLNGQRDAALQAFDRLLRLMPDPPTTSEHWEAMTNYFECLAAQGDAAAALPGAEAAERFFTLRPLAPNSLRRIRLKLGDMYAQLGRTDDARRALGQAFAEYTALEGPERQTRMAATERWARFLLTQRETAQARTLFDAVLAAGNSRFLAHAALARAGLARVALAEHDLPVAARQSAAAQQDWTAVRGFRDVRMGVYIDRVRARVLLADGDTQGAATLAGAALQASRRYDSPNAESIADAQELLAQARQAPNR